MSYKRLWLTLSALLVAMLVISACTAAPAETTGEGTDTEAAADAESSDESAASDEVIEIEYWQYNFEARVDAMDQLIEQFEAENPGISVVHNSEIPYDGFIDQVAASVPAGTGPDVVTLFYGWTLDWVDNGFIVPLPEEDFPADEVRANFSPLVEASFFNDELYTLPTAVRTLALLYNKDLMEQAGLDPESPPTTLEELEEQAVQCTVRDGDDFEVYGFIANPGGQSHHWFRDVLLRQFGQEPLSDDLRTVQWNASDAGYEAWNRMLAFETELMTGRRDFDSDADGFLAGQVCFHIDGSFRLGGIAETAPDLNFGVAELPMHNDVQATYGSYWTHGLTPKATGDSARQEAAVAFLQFITTPEAGALWVDVTGELPAQLEAASDEELINDPQLGAFARGLDYAQATFFVNEADDRQAIIDAYDAVILTEADPNTELDFAVDTVQALYDDFWESQE